MLSALSISKKTGEWARLDFILTIKREKNKLHLVSKIDTLVHIMKQQERSHLAPKSSSTVEKALELLEYFDGQTPYWGLSALARKASLAKATTHRLLSSLKAFDVVERDPETKKYCLGFKLVDLGYRVLDRIKIREIALPYMERLRDRVQETVHLTAEVDGEGIYVEKVEASSSVRLSTRIGARAPLHAGASFKVLLAYLPEERVEQILVRKGLPRITQNTIIDREILEKELVKIRRQGYATSVGELHFGFAAIAAPIRNSEGKVVAGLSVITPSGRLSRREVRHFAAMIKETAREISIRSGWMEDRKRTGIVESSAAQGQ